MSGFAEVHAALRQIMLEAGAGQVVARDEPGDLVVKSQRMDPKTGEAAWFGTVTIKKSYVAYHLMPLYTDPGLAEDISGALAKRRQGKTCFNFTKIDEPLFEELRALTLTADAAEGGAA